MIQPCNLPHDAISPAELKSTRNRLSLSAEAFARMVRVQSGRTVRKWEAGERDIPGPVQVIIDLAEQVPAARRWLLSAAKKR